MKRQVKGPTRKPAAKRQTAALAKRPDAALANAPVDSPHIPAATIVWVKRSRYNPLRILTPDYLSRIIDVWNNGYLRDFALMADAIKRRDPVINIALRKREKGVARHGFEVLLQDGLSGALQTQGQKHQAAIKWFFDHLNVTHVLEQDVRGGFRLLIEQMMSAIGERYAVHEIVWRPSIDSVTGEPRLTADFNFVPVWFFEATTGKLRFIENYFATTLGKDMVDEEWLVTIGEGLMEPLSIAYLIKQAGLEAWAAFAERFGTPGIQGKTSAAKDSQAWNDFSAAVASFGQEWATITSPDAVIELIEAKGGSTTLPFPEMIERMDKAIVTLIRGADLSTISSGKGGQGRGASLQGDETELLEQDDAEQMSETLKKICRIIVKQLFGDDEPLAYLKILVPEKKFNQDTIAKLEFLVSSGVDVGVDFARKELGVPPPITGEALLKPAMNTAQVVATDKPEDSSAALANFAGKDAVFKANAQAQELAHRRVAFRPIAERLAALYALEDPDQRRAAADELRRDAARLRRQVMAKAPDLAKAAENAIGSALIAGYATAAEARK